MAQPAHQYDPGREWNRPAPAPSASHPVLSQWRVKHAQVADAGEAWAPAGHLEQITNIVG
jgi:hypothetical protein